MSVMTIGEPGTPERPLTVDDLEHTPEDGRRYELVDGRLDVSPAPKFMHMRVAHRLSTHLDNLCQGRFEIGEGPGINMSPDGTHHRIPDLVVLDQQVEEDYIDVPPLLAVEVVSASSVIRDSHTKRAEYSAFGIPSYWIINPLADKVALSEMRLENGVYRDVTQVYGEDVFETEHPFPVRLVPHWLTASGPWRDRIGGD